MGLGRSLRRTLGKIAKPLGKKAEEALLGKTNENFEDLKADAFEKRAQANDKFNLQMQALGTQSALDQFQDQLNAWIDQTTLDNQQQGSTRITDYTGLLDQENPFASSVEKTGRKANTNSLSLADVLGTFYGQVNSSKIDLAEASRPKRTDFGTQAEYERAESLWRKRYGK